MGRVGSCAQLRQLTKEGGDDHFLIFVDVDGVLNIGARDAGHPPLVFSDTNMQRSRGLLESGVDLGDRLGSVNTLIAVCEKEVEFDEKSTYGEFTAEGRSSLCKAFVQRLARIIAAAGDRGKRTVVLSSSWRNPQYEKSVRMLEKEISRALGHTFTFDAKTPLGNDKGLEGRVGTIGEFLDNFRTGSEFATAKRLRLLVLDDFCINKVANVPAVEQRLCQRLTEGSPAGKAPDVEACLVHTYDSWTTADGSHIEIGCGITGSHLCRALRFLGEPCDLCGRSVQEDTADDEPVDSVEPVPQVPPASPMKGFDLSKQGLPWFPNNLYLLKVMTGLMCTAQKGEVGQNVENYRSCGTAQV
jgi:hypothetical protein